MDNFNINFSIDSRLEQVWLLRASVGGILRDADIPEGDIFMLQLAVSEVANNCIEHGYRQRSNGRVDVRVNRSGLDLRIEVEDDAPPLPVDRIRGFLQDGTCNTEVDQGWSSRGHGLQMVVGAVSSVDFSRVADRNRVTLTKRLSESAASAGS